MKLFHGTTDFLYERFIKRKGLLPSKQTGVNTIWKKDIVAVRNDVVYLTELFAYAVRYGMLVVMAKRGVHKNPVVLEVEINEDNLDAEEAARKKLNNLAKDEAEKKKLNKVFNWKMSLYMFHSVQTTTQPKILRVGKIPYNKVISDIQFHEYEEYYFDKGCLHPLKEPKEGPSLWDVLVASDCHFAKKYCNWEIEHPYSDEVNI
jgi:hypothetical protein